MPGSTSPIEPAAIGRERSYLLRYALLQLRNPVASLLLPKISAGPRASIN